jgi:hypothetical protein
MTLTVSNCFGVGGLVLPVQWNAMSALLVPNRMTCSLFIALTAIDNCLVSSFTATYCAPSPSAVMNIFMLSVSSVVCAARVSIHATQQHTSHPKRLRTITHKAQATTWLQAMPTWLMCLPRVHMCHVSIIRSLYSFLAGVATVEATHGVCGR